MIEFTDVSKLAEAERAQEKLLQDLPRIPGYYLADPQTPGGAFLCELKADGKFYGLSRILSEPERYGPYRRLVLQDEQQGYGLDFDGKLEATLDVLSKLQEKLEPRGNRDMLKHLGTITDSIRQSLAIHR